jgi:peptidoglycan/xylan/chitin deacetylase (PgdA/CDA1 family)
MPARLAVLLLSTVLATGARAADAGNRLAYLDAFCDPYYVGLDTPRLVTPQWVGEEGVAAVIVLANDDLKDLARHEKYIRPIITRLKEIDPKSGLSLMGTQIDPADPQLQSWIAEGINPEAHTWHHPCPCLQNGSFAKAKATFDACVDNLRRIPGGRTVAFRMPCCDSMNSVSPRFFTEIFGRTTPQGHFLTIDSSVFLLFSADDPELPRAAALDADGRERFRKYIPTDRVMANYVEDYPYPYVIDRLCWEFPALMPSDWDAQHLNGKCSPASVRDYQAAVDAAVAKRGVFSLCFHTHGWIANDQVIEMIDHAASEHPGKVRFLNFHQVQKRLDRNVLAGQSLRTADGGDNGARLVDLNHDGLMDVVIGNGRVRATRVWSPRSGEWIDGGFPVPIVETGAPGPACDAGVRFGVLQENGFASVLVRSEKRAGLWHFDGTGWKADRAGLHGLDLDGPIATSAGGRDRGVRLRDLDGDGVCELLVGNERQNGAFRWAADRNTWQRLPFALPEGTAVVDRQGRDAGLRFVDVNEDGRADCVFSNAERYSVDLFTSMAEGWSRRVLSGERGERPAEEEVPMIVRADGTNNGAWFNFGQMWVQNEETGKKLPDEVDRRSLAEDFLAKPTRQGDPL